MSAASAPIRDAAGAVIGTFAVSNLPGRSDRLELVDEQIVLQEEGTYVFRTEGIRLLGDLKIQPSDELFSFDDASRSRGRLLPRQHVGRIRVSVRSAEVEGVVVLSVRPKKLDEETEYRQMLDDIADIAAEAILQGFAPASLALVHNSATRPELLYQQFAFLHARLSGAGEHDLALVLNRPHRAWVDQEEHRLPGAPVRGGARQIRALTRSGARVPTPANAALRSLPLRLAITRSEETLDTEPNRFIAFALERWRELACRVRDNFSDQLRRSGPVARGIDAADEVIAILDRALSAPMFREVGRLASFPIANQVLQKRAGYRELLRTFVLTETGAQLALDWDIQDAFAASQRNIATLYEYWAFLQLAKSVGQVCGEDLSPHVLEPAKDGLSLAFSRGKASRLRWTTSARGRSMVVELYFNRDFLASRVLDASWTRAMRPDCSLRIRPDGFSTDVSADDLSVWLHFDAKYRVEYAEQFAKPPADDGDRAVEAEAIERLARSKREDLLKMHAYRDAIRRSAGAYVLYPGEQHHEPFVEHHEILPGVGAFVLRPTSGDSAGTDVLERFLADVLDHVADRSTHHERSRYWGAVIHRVPPPTGGNPDRRLPVLARPPSDTQVLCGFVRTVGHRQWVEHHGIYNVRAGDRPGAVGADAALLQATDVVLYGRDIRPTLWGRAGAWFVQSQDEMAALAYPDPGGRVYLCCPIERREDEPEWLGLLQLDSERWSGQPIGTPFVTTWQDLLDASVS